MKKYLVLLVDRKRARMFTLLNGKAVNHLELKSEQAPSKVKSGENTWDAADKISRHVEDHLNRHLKEVAAEVAKYTVKDKITDILIGGHETLFHKVEEHLKYPCTKKIRGSFVTELKVPQKVVLKKALQLIDKLEIKMEKQKLQKALA